LICFTGTQTTCATVASKSGALGGQSRKFLLDFLIWLTFTLVFKFMTCLLLFLKS